MSVVLVERFRLITKWFVDQQMVIPAADIAIAAAALTEQAATIARQAAQIQALERDAERASELHTGLGTQLPLDDDGPAGFGTTFKPYEGNR